MPPLLLVLTGKTAAGKDTIMLQLLVKLPSLRRIITTTSRPMRENEENGVDYNFISESNFRQKIEKGEFIEYVEYGKNLYGTEKSQLTDNLNSNLIWRIDPSRAGQIRQLIKDSKVLVIYLTTPDEVVLERLKKRGLNEEEIKARMQDDKRFWEEFKNNYDFVVENIPGQLDQTVDKIVSIIEKSRS